MTRFAAKYVRTRTVIVARYDIKTVRVTQCTADVTRQLVVTVSATRTCASYLAVTSRIKYRRRTDRGNRARYGRSVVITVTRLARDRGRAGPVRLRRDSWRRTTVARVTCRRIAQRRCRGKVNIVIDVARVGGHGSVVGIGRVTLTTICRTSGIRTVGNRSYMRVVSTTASRTVAVAKGTVSSTRYRAPRVRHRRSTTRSVLVTIVRTAGTVSSRRKCKLTRVLGRDRSAAYLNSTVKNGRCRTSDKVRVGRVVRMASRTIDRQTERVCSRVVRTMTACRRRITVTERTVTCRTRIPVSQCARIGRIVTVRRRTRVVRRAGTVNETVSTSTSVMSTVVNFGVKTRRVHISVTLGKDPQRVRTRIICIVMIKRTRASRLNARMTVSTLKISSYMSVMGARTRGITVTRGTVET